LFNFSKFLRIIGLKKQPHISSMDALQTFIDENAAFVSQVSLYTYVKARAGTSFPKMFENKDFLTSLSISRWHIYAASVSDLALFSAAQFQGSGFADQPECCAITTYLGTRILSQVEQNDVDQSVFDQAATRLKKRAKSADFLNPDEGKIYFTNSSDAFMEWAPVVDEFKALDEEIMRNSMYLRWIGIRQELKERLKHDAAYADWIMITNNSKFAAER